MRDLPLTRRYLPVVLLAAGLVVAGLIYARSRSDRPQVRSRAGEAPESGVSAVYADPASCAECHDEIARTYGLTGMARSFAKLRGQPWLAEAVGAGGAPSGTRLYHAASDRHYTIVQRDGRFYQRRHDVGFDGLEANVIEVEANYVVGSGNHARTFLHRSSDGRLRQLPVSWYAGRGGSWAMSPGYDRPAHLDFRRLVLEDCMSCHNGYPRAAVRDDGTGPKFPEPLPEGIDCQRCHGPAQAHVDAIRAGDVERGRGAVANPADFPRDRQLETCMQCHLETTSSPLPFQVRRYEHPAFAYSPGKALADYFVHFDHAPGAGRDDKFEIAGGAYRLRKSACFQRSEMTCVTCHDPHDVPRGAAAVQRYVAVCEGCHKGVHGAGAPPVPGPGPRATCIDCHMPKRRTEDAVHVVMTDHYIQRRRAIVDLLAPRKEADNFEHGAYRGEVVLYYPPTLPPTPDNDLYVALAQVQQGANLAAGIAQLEQAIATHRPARAEFYYELARAHAKTNNHEAAIRWSGEALRRDPGFAPAYTESAAAAMATGRLAQAARALEQAVALRPGDADALADLGNAYLQLDRVGEAGRMAARALSLDGSLAGANNTMALAALRQGDAAAAETHLREALRHQPDFAEGLKNLGNLLAGRKAYAEAGFHFERAIRANPGDVETRRAYGMVLALTRAFPRAVEELQAALRLAPHLVEARLDLADVLVAMGRTDRAVREYEIVAEQSTDPAMRQAASEALRALGR